MPLARHWPLALSAALALTPAPTRAQCIPEWTPGFGATGMGGSVYAESVYDDGTGDALFAGGLFTKAGGITAQNIARWDGTVWAPVGSGLSTGPVRAIAPYDPDGPGPAPAVLAVGGDFTGFVSVWNGSIWTTPPNVPDGAVRALVVFDDGSGPALYVAGDFLNAGGHSAAHIAKWNGATWSNLGSGISGNVYSLAVFDDGAGPALYAGGIFTKAGGGDANRIARWNGISWSSLGAGTSGAIAALAVFDDGAGPALYAGGLFNKAGGADASRIARWDGVAWSPLKGGVSDIVYSMAVHNDGAGPALYVGGQFTQADGDPAVHIARWGGPAAGWSALGIGADNNVLALADFEDQHGPALIAGGDFVEAGGGTVNRIAQWRDGSWSGLGAALGKTASALEVFDDGAGPALYAAGEFIDAGGTAANHIGRWNGTFWSPLGSGLDQPCRAEEVYDDGAGPALYAGGEFSTAGGDPASRIARWDGASWSALGAGITGTAVRALRVFDDGAGPALYAAGQFTSPGSNIARWNGLSWSALGAGTNSIVESLAVFDDGGGPSLYAAGDFTKAGGASALQIAKWNGLSWSTLGSGLNNTCYAILTFDDGAGPALYATGKFTSAGGHPVSNIARWNGLDWSALGAGLNGIGRALAVHDDGTGTGPALYAAGEFTQAGGKSASGVAKWDGLQWSALGTGINLTGYALATFPESQDQSALFIGGQFVTAGGIPSANIARWGCPAPPADLCEVPLLIAPDGHPGDFLGESVAISGDTMVVGAFGDDTAGDNAGAAHIFTGSAGAWSYTQALTPGDLIAGDFFGAASAIYGPYAVIGAPRSDPAGANSGAVYVFRDDGGLWVPDAKLVPDDVKQGDQFGFAVAILGDVIIAGSWHADLPGKADAGAAYIFAREGGAWVQKVKLTASDASTSDNFGFSVALTDQFAIAGAPGDDNPGGVDAGAAYVFFHVGDQWGDWEKLTAGDSHPGDKFGSNVAGDGLRLIVGAPGADTVAPDAGQAYVFRVSGGHWIPEDTLTPAGLKPGDALGSAVAIRGPIALVGGEKSDLQGEDSGAVSLFERSGAGWFETAKLTGKAVQPGDYLGVSVAIGPSDLAAGALFHDGPGGDQQGAVIVFSTSGCPCYPDFTGDGALDLFDFLGYVNAFNAQQPAADCTQDGVFDLFDFLCFVNAFNAGC